MKPDRAWVLLPSGKRQDLLTPDPSAWTDRDLAISLSRTYRWGGHSRWELPLSVAQHSLLVLVMRQKMNALKPLSRAEALPELLHDAEEGFLCFDPISPLKPHLGEDFNCVSNRLRAAIANRYDIQPWEGADNLLHKQADHLAAASEAYHVTGWSRADIRDSLHIRREWKKPGLSARPWEPRGKLEGGGAVEWTVKLEAKFGWGEVRSFEVGRLSRRVQALTADEIGLMLDEAKTLLAELQRHMVESQIEEKVACVRVCAICLQSQPIRDRRTRTLQTLFGTVRVDAPRIRLCACIDKTPFEDVSFSPLAELLPDRCTPELRRLQAGLGARHSFREAADLLATFLPCSPPNHASVRNRLHRVAVAVEGAEISSATPPSDGSREASDGSHDDITVLIDGAHIRAAPGHQTRHLDVIVGKVESQGRKPRRFAMAPLAADQPLAQIRAALTEQGWTSERPVTVISDGEAALPELVRRATGSDIRHILDWWHISMRVRHVEQALAGVCALEPVHRGGLDMIEYGTSRLRHLIWNGYHHEARRELFDARQLADEAVYLNGERLRPAVSRFLARCEELHGYLANNEAALVDYSRRYHSGQPVSTSRAEGCVDEIANARMAKRRRMRWSPRGAHRVAVVRAAVLDGRLHTHAQRLAA